MNRIIAAFDCPGGRLILLTNTFFLLGLLTVGIGHWTVFVLWYGVCIAFAGYADDLAAWINDGR